MGDSDSMGGMFRQLIAKGNGEMLMQLQENIKIEEEGPQLLQVSFQSSDPVAVRY
jgi:hypothetical protein